MTWEHWTVTAIVVGAAIWLIRTAILTVRAGLNPKEGVPGCVGCPAKKGARSRNGSLVTKPLVQIGTGISAKRQPSDV